MVIKEFSERLLVDDVGVEEKVLEVGLGLEVVAIVGVTGTLRARPLRRLCPLTLGRGRPPGVAEKG